MELMEVKGNFCSKFKFIFPSFDKSLIKEISIACCGFQWQAWNLKNWVSQWQTSPPTLSHSWGFLLCDITRLKLRLAQQRCQASRIFPHSHLGLISRVFKFRLTIHFSSLNGTLDWILFFYILVYTHNFLHFNSFRLDICKGGAILF